MSGAHESDLHLAPEATVVLEVDGQVLASWLCTPESLEAMAAGWLVGEGVVRSAGEILEVSGDPERGRVRARFVDALRDRASARAVTDVPAGPSRMTPELRELLGARGRLGDLFAAMFDRAPLRAPGGGLHTGGRVTAGVLEEVVEDVGKSNVVDKLVGRAVLSGVALDDSLFLLSGRLSAPVVAKCCRSGVAALASISIPTTLARELAARSGLTLVGRSRSGSPQIHWA